MLVFISEHRRHTQTGYGCTRGRDWRAGSYLSAFCFYCLNRDCYLCLLSWDQSLEQDTATFSEAHVRLERHKSKRAHTEHKGNVRAQWKRTQQWNSIASCAKLDCWTQCSLILIRVVWEETDGIKRQLVTRQSCSHPWLKFLLLNIKHFPLWLCTADPFSSKKRFSFCWLVMLLYWFNLTSIVFAQRQILLRRWSRPKSYQQVNIVKLFCSDSKLSESGGKKSDIFRNSWLLISRNSLYESRFVGKLGWGLAEGEASL